MAKKRLTKSTPIVFALFRLFSLVFDRFRTFSPVFAIFGMSVFDRFWPSVFAFFAPFAPFSGCHLDSPEYYYPTAVDLVLLEKHWCRIRSERKCRESVPGVSKKGVLDTPGTLSGHFWTLRSPGPEGPQGHPERHPEGHFGPDSEGQERPHSRHS